MENSINGRITALMESQRLNINNFSKEIGKSYTAVHAITKGNSKPGYDLLESILEKYPQLNATWLLTGKGEMFEVAAPVELASDSYLREHLKTLEGNFARLASQLETKDTQIDRLTRMLESVLGKHEDAPTEGRVLPLWSELKAVI